jgi:hypothetical protein
MLDRASSTFISPRMPPNRTAYNPHIYLECDIPDGMTLIDWRRARRKQDPAPPLSRVLGRARRAFGGRRRRDAT